MSTKEAKLDLSGSRRRGSAPKAGSVWESRMKLDEVKGGFRVFNPTHENTPENSPNTVSTSSPDNNPEAQTDKKPSDVLRPKQSSTGMSGKRKTWKSESPEAGPLLQIARQRSESRRSLDQELKKSPGWTKKKRSISCGDGEEKNGAAAQVRKVKSDSSDQGADDGETETDSKKSDSENVKTDQANKDVEGDDGKMDSRSDEGCDEKVIKIGGNAGRITADGEKNEDDGEDEEKDKEIEVEKKSVEIKEISKRIVVDEKTKLVHSSEKRVPFSSSLKKQPPPVARFQSSTTKTKPISDDFHGVTRTNSRLQSFVDLVMWRDVSKSAFIFGIGTFGIISSSYTKDLNISFISVVSYLGLVYLAAIFLFRSLISRGSMNMDSADEDCVVGEEEAIWVVKLILPYLNEFLLKLRALFSGDPSTTMKLAVLLFILARCGSSITIWKMAKLGFIGVFTVPKICSTYSSQFTAYGTFWIRRFRDAWESCSHKKAVAFAIFTLVWNLSSVLARIWAVFMLFVTFKYYQQSMITKGWANEEKATSIGGHESGRRSTQAEMRKQKKVF